MPAETSSSCRANSVCLPAVVRHPHCSREERREDSTNSKQNKLKTQTARTSALQDKIRAFSASLNVNSSAAVPFPESSFLNTRLTSAKFGTFESDRVKKKHLAVDRALHQFARRKSLAHALLQLAHVRPEAKTTSMSRCGLQHQGCSLQRLFAIFSLLSAQQQDLRASIATTADEGCQVKGDHKVPPRGCFSNCPFFVLRAGFCSSESKNSKIADETCQSHDSKGP